MTTDTNTNTNTTDINNTNTLEELLEVTEEVRPQRRYKRIKFTESGLLDLTDPATLLVSQIPVTTVSNAVIKQKLEGYRIVPRAEFDRLLAGNKRWYRAIKARDGEPVKFISGGFLIKNGEQFLTLLNVSLSFSFNVQKDEIILFERKSDSEKLNPRLTDFLRDRDYTKKVKVMLKDDLSQLFINSVTSKLVREDISFKRKSLVKAFTKQQNKYKKFYIMTIDKEDIESIKQRVVVLREQVGTDVFVNNDTEVINQLVDISFGQSTT